MKTAQEIASNVVDPSTKWEARHLAKQAPGKAQQAVLDALGVTANNYAHAEEIFTALGICVIAKRQGRTSVPMVTRLEAVGGGWNPGGDGDSWTINQPNVDLSALAQWMVQ